MNIAQRRSLSVQGARGQITKIGCGRPHVVQRGNTGEARMNPLTKSVGDDEGEDMGCADGIRWPGGGGASGRWGKILQPIRCIAVQRIMRPIRGKVR